MITDVYILPNLHTQTLVHTLWYFFMEKNPNDIPQETRKLVHQIQKTKLHILKYYGC